MATTHITIVINSPPATSISFAAAQSQFVAPLPAGTLLGTLSVLPATWSGSVTLSGPALGKVLLQGLQIVTAVQIDTSDVLEIDATATP